MKMIPPFILGCALLFLTCCMSIHELHHTGDTLELTYAGREFRCELLAITDSVMYLIPLADQRTDLVLAPGKIYAALPYVFAAGDVLGYANRGWVYPFLGFQVLPIVLLGIQAGIYHQSTGAFFYYSLALGTMSILDWLLLYFGTDEFPHFDEALTPPTLAEFRKYARYPLGLTDEQLQLLLAVRNQTEPMALPTIVRARSYRIIGP